MDRAFFTLMLGDRIPKQLLYCEICHCKRPVAKPRTRVKDSLKVTLQDLSTNTETPEKLAADRSTMRNFVQKGALNS